MAFKDVIKLHGVGELSALLKKLPRDVRVITTVKAVSAGADTMLEKARAETPIGKGRFKSKSLYASGKHKPGNLRKSLYSFPAKKRGNTVWYSVGATFLHGVAFDEAFYGAFLEFGHRLGKRTLRQRIKIGTVVDNALARGRKRGRKKSIFQTTDPRRQIPPNPFLERAFKSGRGPALQKIIEITRAEIMQRARVKGAVGI